MAGEDRAHTAYLRTLRCCAPGCGRPAQVAHHQTGAGMGRRAHDHEAMPMCDPCHRDLHEFRGRFLGWDRWLRARWQQEQVERYRPACCAETAEVPW